MLSFKPLELTDITLLRPYYNQPHERICDHTPGVALMWRDFFRTEFALYDGALILKQDYFGRFTAFLPPVGGHYENALRAMSAYARQEGIPFRLCNATQADAGRAAALYETECSEEAEWADYIYLAESLATLRGRKLNGQRNHINYFRRSWPEHRLEPVQESNVGDVLELFARYNAASAKDNPMLREEKAKTLELLANWTLYGQSGLLLYVGDEAVAFAIGEVVADTLYVHVEKADNRYRGAYQMIVNGFAAAQMDKGIVYVNREEDAGDAGVRTAKLAYHPHELLRKHIVLLKN